MPFGIMGSRAIDLVVTHNLCKKGTEILEIKVGLFFEVMELGITFISKNEQFDTSSAIGEAMLKIILVFAELERNMVSERVSAVMLDRAKNGAWNGGRSPTGYRIENGK